MKSREFSKYADGSTARSLLNSLSDQSLSIACYKEAMVKIGRTLASTLTDAFKQSNNDIFIVCTVEDADFLARGIIDELEDAGFASRIRLYCIWNAKVREEGVSLSPILRQYKERKSSNSSIVVIVKSIISGACVVKTNLTRALSSLHPEEIFVVAPVLLDGAQTRLAEEFPAHIVEQFEYRWLATDFEKDGETVIPGIGGSVYQRLGLASELEKNKITPAIVRARREAHAARG